VFTRTGSGPRLLVALVVSAFVAGLTFQLDAQAARKGLPTRLTDQEFWKLSADLSEQDGAFRSDNLVSNEVWLQYVIPDLLKTVPPAGVYLGVGPEQNFTYIAALRPAMAFIIDVRRGNLDLHLMYKALFELSANRAEFVSRLFSRRQPDGINEQSTAADIFKAFSHVERSQPLYDETLVTIKRQLVARHGFALSGDDWSSIESAFDALSTFGPNIHYLSTGTDTYGGGLLPSYADLMTATDDEGVPHSYLNTEDGFRLMKDLETKNLIVPVVGDFAGPKAVRAIGTYLRERGTTVSAFYLSNVEMYLEREMTWGSFCRNVAQLPLDASSVFIRSAFDGQYGHGFGLNSDVGPLLPHVDRCLPSQH
jgi:hypothetical protein